MKINLIPPALVLTRKIKTKGAVGRAYGPLLFIDPDARNPEQVTSHEIMHSWQWWVLSIPACVALWFIVPMFAVFGILTMPLLNWIPIVRLHFECMAYAYDSKHSDNPAEYISNISKVLVTNYDLLKRYSHAKSEKLMLKYAKVMGIYE